jgi:cytochrome c2
VVPANSDVLTLAVDGQSKAQWSRNDLTGRFSPAVVRVWDPFEQAEVAFDAVPLQAVLDAGLGTGWRQRQDLLFVAKDGYTAPLPVARLLAKPAWLAVARAGGKPLQLQPKAGGQIDAAPYYVIWDSLSDAELRQEGDHGWPFQTVRIDVADLAQRYPKLQLPATASPAATRGAAVFTGWCLPCHALGGQGGSVGPELAEPIGVVHVWQPRWLAAWIDDPAKVRRGAKMPAPPLPAGDRQQHITDVIAFLQAVSPTPTDVP